MADAWIVMIAYGHQPGETWLFNDETKARKVLEQVRAAHKECACAVRLYRRVE